MIGKDRAINTGREGGESGEQPSLNTRSQPRQGKKKTMGLLTGDWEGYSMLKSHESMVEKYWELCRVITHVVNDYVIVDIHLKLLHNG